MPHVTWDAIGIAQYNFMKSKMAAMHIALALVNLHLKTLETELKRF